jgi:hypothetical protein
MDFVGNKRLAIEVPADSYKRREVLELFVGREPSQFVFGGKIGQKSFRNPIHKRTPR